MESVTLSEAWVKWFAGKDVSNLALWGTSILWWGRVGKLISLFSAMTIIADIIGPSRLRSFGSSLHKRFELRQLMDHVRRAFLWYPLMLKRSFSKLSIESERAQMDVSEFWAYKVNIVVSIVIVLSFLMWSDTPWLSGLLASVGFFAAGFYTVFPIITILMIVLSTTILALIDSILIEPVAWVLERESLETWIRAGSLLLLLIGFHFDLLSE